MYDIGGTRRLLAVAQERTEASLRSCLDSLGETACERVKYVCSDMWKPYLNVIAERLGQAVHVLDRFHVMQKFGKALDEIRAEEAKRLKRDGYEPVLKRSRWCFLKRPENLTDKQTVKLSELLKYNLRTVRAYLLREEFQRLWEYKSAWWAGKFLDEWTGRVMRSRLEPMKKVARTIRSHRPLILNWFRARGEVSSGAVEGLNNKVKLVTRKSYGFRTARGGETGPPAQPWPPAGAETHPQILLRSLFFMAWDRPACSERRRPLRQGRRPCNFIREYASAHVRQSVWGLYAKESPPGTFGGRPP